MPVHDIEFLSWPLLHDSILKILTIKSLQQKNIFMVSDLLDPVWNIQTKEEIEQNNYVTLNFLEYLAIQQGISKYIKDAKMTTRNLKPNRPEMLNLIFSQKKLSPNLSKNR